MRIKRSLVGFRDGPAASPVFRKVWLAQLVSITGDQIFPIAAIVLVQQRGGSPSELGAVFGLRFVGLGLFIVLGGVVADRYNRATFIVTLHMIRAAILGGLILAGATPSITVLLVVSFTLGAAEALFFPAYEAMLPSTVGKRFLGEANAASSFVSSTGRVIGPVAAAGLIAAVGVRVGLIVDLATFVIAAALFWLVRHDTSHVVTAQRAGTMLSQAFAGFQFVSGMRWLRAVEIIAIFHVLVAVGPWFIVVPTVAEERLGGIQAFGILTSAFFAGGAVGGLAGGFAKMQARGYWALAGIGSFAIAVAGIGELNSTLAIGATFVLAGAGTQFFDVIKTRGI